MAVVVQTVLGSHFRVGCATDMAVVVKAVLGSHFGVGAPPIWLWLSKPFSTPILG